MAKHGVVRTDLLDGTDVRADLVSVKYFKDDEPAEIDNGNVVKISALMEGEREIYVGEDVEAKTDIKDVVLLAAPEVMYDERLRNLDDYYNEAGKAIRGYRINHAGQIFSVTKECLVGVAKPEVGNVVELAAGTKLSVAASASGNTLVGEILDIEVVGRHTYFAIKLA